MAEPVTLAEAKLNLRVTSPDEDARITSLIVVARQKIEADTGLVLTPRAITETVARLGESLTLNSWPITSVDGILYPSGGVMTALDSSAWMVSLKRRPVRIIPAAFNWGLGGVDCGWGGGLWGRHDLHHHAVLPVEIDITAGYPTPDDVPETVKQAMHLLIGHLYTNRSAVESGLRAAAIELPMGVASLLDSFTLDYV